MNIQLVMTGGTIGSEEKEDISINEFTSQVADSLLRRYAGLFSYDISSPYLTSSENMDISLWNKLVHHLYDLDLLGKTDVDNDHRTDGVIITTGTDTLAYTSSLLALLFAATNVPIVLVSSNYVLTDTRTNGFDNFEAAVKIIEGFKNGELPADIYVPYRNSDRIIYIHRGIHLNQARGFSGDFFSGKIFARTDIKKNIIYVNDHDMNNDKKSNQNEHHIKWNNNFTLISDLFSVSPYVGIDYSRYRLDNAKAVIHELYHSATAPSIVSVLKTQCDKIGIPLFMAPVNSRNKNYETTEKFIDQGIIPVYDMTWETSFAKVLIGLSLGTKDIEKFLSNEINNEFM